MAQNTDNPVFKTKVECPVCKNINGIDTIKVGAYTEEGRDTDFCPKKRIWKNPSYQRYSPLLFFMATCPECYFTREFNSKYKDWKNDAAFRDYRLKTQKEKHLQELRDEDGVIRFLGSSLDAEKYPFATAVNRILLGIYDEKFNLKRSNLDLGRYFLRIAWLFRENSEDSGDKSGQLAGHAMKIEDIILKLGHMYEQVRREVDSFKKSGNDFLSDALFPDGDEKAKLSEHYSEGLNDLNAGLDKFKAGVVNLKASLPVSSEVMTSYASSSSPIDHPFGAYKTYREFLKELKSKWPEAPISEHEALNQAAKYYMAAYETGNEISAGNQAIQAVYLIAELSRRVGRHEEAKQYFNTAIKLAQEYILQNKGDRSRTALARKIMELALEQGKLNLKTIEQGADEPA
jgi:uncharacterized protein (DUF2225 family)